MTEPARIPCCISGCKRTFKCEPGEDASSETMCGKHYRCDRELVIRRKQTRARHRKIERAISRLERQVARQSAGAAGLRYTPAQSKMFSRLYKLIHTAARLDNAAWKAIKAEAQRWQDAGFFAPKPRGRKVPESTFAPELSAGERKVATGFEAEFQRMKRAQAAGRGPC